MKTCNVAKKLALGVMLGGLVAFQAGAIVAYNNPNPIASAGVQTGGPFQFSMGNHGYVMSMTSHHAIAMPGFHLGCTGEYLLIM